MPKKEQFTFVLSNLGGAFADGAILFPLLVLLSQQIGFSNVVLLTSAGCAYIWAGFYFRVPMPVQPLKSLVITAVAMQASILEVRIATVLFGILCIFLCYAQVHKYLSKFPKHLIHGLQVSLGLILILKGLSFFSATSPATNTFLLIILSVVLIALIHSLRQPLLGWAAAVGLLLALYNALGSFPAPLQQNSIDAGQLRFDIILSLIIPQILLTLTNSVVATEAVAKQYFAERAHRVSKSRLLLSIGIGNLISGVLSGLPFCHGSGGLTAHVKGGSYHYLSNIMIGSFLLAAGAYAWMSHPLLLAYPPLVTSLLLVATGWLHLALAKPSWNNPRYRLPLISMALVALGTQNLLLSLIAGITVEIVHNAMRKYGEAK